MKIFSHTVNGYRPGPHLLITAGVHGDEYEPIAAVWQLINTLDPAVLSGRATLAPLINKPAFERASRTGNDQLDLARTCPGRADGSETERIAYALSGMISGADFYIDLHTGGNLFEIAPLAGYLLHHSEEVLEKQRKMARAFNLPIVWGTSAEVEGRSLSVARDAGVPAIYAEFGGGGGVKKEIIEAYVDGCRNVMAALQMLPGSVPESQVLYTVEDKRKNSGHLQSMLPAPREGFFEPAVGLGEIVEEGQILGSILNLEGGPLSPVYAPESGKVFFLRRAPSVKKGDTLGGLLPILKQGKVIISR